MKASMSFNKSYIFCSRKIIHLNIRANYSSILLTSYFILDLLLTLFQVGLKIYVSWWGGAFKAPPMFSLKLTFLDPKNDKTIYPHIFEDLMKGFRAQTPPSGPQKPYFLRHLKKCWNLEIFKKVGFLGARGGGFGF